MNQRIATAEGLIETAIGSAPTVPGPVRVFGDIVIAGGRRVLWHGERGWVEIGNAGGLLCAVDAPGGVIVGTEGAHLLRHTAAGLELIRSFDAIDGRDDWHTPWGGPPEVRSLACTPDNVLFANVHVGGIARSDDGGRTWNPMVDIKHDVHQVRSARGRDDLIVAASAIGLLISFDAGVTWRVHALGLHATYCRSVAVSDEAIFISASEGPRGHQSAVYRTNIDATDEFERVTDWIDGNVDSNALDARGGQAAFGTPRGEVFESLDSGVTWTRTRHGLAPITSLSLVA